MDNRHLSVMLLQRRWGKSFQVPNAASGKSGSHAVALGYALGIAIEAVQGGYLLVFASQIALAVGEAHISVVIESGKERGDGSCGRRGS